MKVGIVTVAYNLKAYGDNGRTRYSFEKKYAIF